MQWLKNKFHYSSICTQTHSRRLTVVELTVALLTVDDIKTVGDVCLHITDFKVKPLSMLGTVGVCVQYEIIFKPTREQRGDVCSYPSLTSLAPHLDRVCLSVPADLNCLSQVPRLKLGEKPQGIRRTLKTGNKKINTQIF